MRCQQRCGCVVWKDWAGWLASKMAYTVYYSDDFDAVTSESMNQSWTDTYDNATASFNMTAKELLVKYLGPQHRSLPETIILTIVYCAIFITGVLGNVCTCIVIAKNSYMQTATNYYLVSLACSDVLTLLLGELSLLLYHSNACFLLPHNLFMSAMLLNSF